MPTPAIRVVLADDHALFREALRQVLETSATITVVGQAADGHEAIRLVTELQPDVVLMDIQMPQTDGLRATQHIVTHAPTTQVVVLSMHEGDDYLSHAIRAGATSYLLKTSRAEEVIRAIEVAARGGATIDAALGSTLLREYQRRLEVPTTSERRLSERDAELLRLLAAGFTNRQMAEHLALAESTVKNCLSALFQTIGVRDRTQAALSAVAQGVATPPPGPR